MPALNDTEVAQCLEIFGLPESGTAIIATSLSHRPPSLSQTWEPTYTTGNFTTLVTLVKAQLAAMSTENCARVRDIHLARWTELGSTNPMRLTGSDGAAGVVVDAETERENIRQAIGNIAGVACPKGGFMADTARSYPTTASKSTANLGDR